MTDRERHHSIEFSPASISPEKCPRCHRVKALGKCNDGCEMCQSCFTLMHGGDPLQSDTMDL